MYFSPTPRDICIEAVPGLKVVAHVTMRFVTSDGHLLGAKVLRVPLLEERV